MPTAAWLVRVRESRSRSPGPPDENRSQVSTERVEHEVLQISADRIGSTGAPRHAETALEVGAFGGAARSLPIDTSTNAESGSDVDHLFQHADGRDSRPTIATITGDDGSRLPTVAEARVHFRERPGSRRSRDMAKMMRVAPIIRVSTTVVRPATAPAAMTVAIHV